MSRLGLVVAALAGLGLAGCSGMPDWMTPSMPDWLSSKPAGPQLANLQFESQPPGADVHTTQGQTCLTPCSLPVPAESQVVTINKIGFVPQTVQITAGEPPEHMFWESAPPPTLVPNPVQVVLQAVPPPVRPIHRHRPPPHHVSSRTRTAAKMAPGHSGAASDPPPPSEQPGGSPFPPPSTEPAASPFPPPPPVQGQQ